MVVSFIFDVFICENTATDKAQRYIILKTHCISDASMITVFNSIVSCCVTYRLIFNSKRTNCFKMIFEYPLFAAILFSSSISVSVLMQNYTSVLSEALYTHTNLHYCCDTALLHFHYRYMYNG